MNKVNRQSYFITSGCDNCEPYDAGNCTAVCEHLDSCDFGNTENGYIRVDESTSANCTRVCSPAWCMDSDRLITEMAALNSILSRFC